MKNIITEETSMKIFKKILPIVIIVVVAYLIYSFYHIDGREIKNINNLSSDCRVSVVVEKTYGDDNRQEYELNPEQIESLKNLLMNNSYKRRLFSTIIGQLPEKDYTILADWDKDGTPQVLLYIRIIGNEYINFSRQFNFFNHNIYHKIKNPDFEKELISILELK